MEDVPPEPPDVAETGAGADGANAGTPTGAAGDGAAGDAVGVGLATGTTDSTGSAVARAEVNAAAESTLAKVSVLTAKAAVAVPRTPTTVSTVRNCDFIFQMYKTGSIEVPLEYPRLGQLFSCPGKTPPYMSEKLVVVLALAL